MLRMYKIPCEKKVEKNGVQNTFGKATCCQKGKFLKYDKLELTDYLLPDFNIFIAYLLKHGIIKRFISFFALH